MYKKKTISHVDPKNKFYMSQNSELCALLKNKHIYYILNIFLIKKCLKKFTLL